MIQKSVVIIGRPNVGKSTLFNRLAQNTRALVDDRPGVTRDWKEAQGHLADLNFKIIDTAGLEGFESPELVQQILRQTDFVITQADIVLLIVDGRDGILPSDRELAYKLRCAHKPAYVLINKAENRQRIVGLDEVHKLGLGNPILISAAHGDGIDALYEILKPHVLEKESLLDSDNLSDNKFVPDDKDASLDFIESNNQQEDIDDSLQPLSLVVIGRPNAGKSSLINKLIGQERLIASDQPGITRDAITLNWMWKGRPFHLVDTAGIRRRARVEDQLERASVRDALQAVRYAHVVLLLVDARSPLDKQDILLASKVIEEGRCLVIGLNKWDIADPQVLKQVQHTLETSLSQVKGLPCIPLSAKTGRNIDKIMQAVQEVYHQWNRRLPTSRLNQWLERAVERHPTPLIGSKRVRLKYMAQIKTRPPTFVIFVSKPMELPESYTRYLIASLAQEFKFYGVPIRLYLRKGRNPYVSLEKAK